MLATGSLANRLLHATLANRVSSNFCRLTSLDSPSPAHPFSCTRAHSSRQEPEKPSEPSPTPEWPEVKQHVQALRSATGVHRRELNDSGALSLLNAVWFANSWLERAWATYISWHVEKEFDLADFRAGAKHAFHTVNELLGSGEMHQLQPMLSPRLHQTLSDMRTAYKQEGCTVSVEVGDIHEQNIYFAEAHTATHMARFGVKTSDSGDAGATPATPSGSDEEPTSSASQQQKHDASGETQASESPKSSSCASIELSHLSKLRPLWLAVTVRFRGRIITKVTDSDGKVLSEDDDKRSQYWKFVRGPLPFSLPAQSVDSPWYLLNMQ